MPNVELEFNYPKIPDNVDDEMRRFLIELRHLLLRKLVGPGFINDITSIIVNEGYSNIFKTVAVSGQDDVVADSEEDTLTLVAGSNVTLTTNAGTDSVTIAASGVGTLTIEAHTSDDTLTEAESGSVHTNRGATGTITLTLPSSPPTGTHFYFCVAEHLKELRVEPGDGVAILATINYSPGFYIHNNSIGTSVGLVFDGSDWVVLYDSGPWNSEN